MVKATIPISYFHILNALINLTQGLPKSQPEEEKERKRMGKKNTDKEKRWLEQLASQFAKLQSSFLCFCSLGSCSVSVHISLHNCETLLEWHCVLHKGGRVKRLGNGPGSKMWVRLILQDHKMSTFLTVYPTSV